MPSRTDILSAFVWATSHFVRGRWIALGVIALGTYEVDERLLLLPDFSLNQALILLMVPLLCYSVIQREQERSLGLLGFALPFGLLVTASNLWTSGHDAGLVKTVNWWLALAATLVFVGGMGRDEIGARRGLLGLASIGILLGMLGLLTYAAMGWSGRLSVLGGGPNVYSRWVGTAIIVALCLGSMARDLRLFWRVLLLGLAGALAMAFLLANSKGGLVGLCVALGYWMLAARRHGVARRLIGTGIGAIVLTVVGLYLIEPTAYARFLLSPTDPQSVGSYGARFEFYQSALTTSLEYPLFGAGVGGWAMAMHGWDDGLYPHNLPLEILAEYGFLLGGATILWYSTIAVVLWRRQRDGWDSVCSRALFLFYLTVSMFSGDLTDGRIALLGLALLEWSSAREWRTFRSSVSTVG